jgi:AraC family transcriptional regulator
MVMEQFDYQGDRTVSHGSAQDTHVVETSMSLDSGEIWLVRYSWERSTSDVWTADHYFLHMCLSSRPGPARATYLDVDHVISEGLGPVMFVPPGRTVRSGGCSGSQLSLLCAMYPQMIERILGGQPCWNDAALAEGLHLDSPEVEWLLLKMYDEIRFPGFAQKVMAESLLNGAAVAVIRALGLHLKEPRRYRGGMAPWRMRLIRERILSDQPMPTLVELAELSRMSVRHLTRAFKEEKGITIAKFIEHAMAKRARALLSDTNLSIEEIARRQGFASPSSFSYAFRRAVGSRPIDFRRRFHPAAKFQPEITD